MAEDDYTALVGRIAGNDTVAFEQLYHSLFPASLQLARGLIGNDTEAEDIVHEVFLHLWENRRTLDKIRQVKNYVLTMVRHRAYNLIRHQGHVQKHALSGEVPSDSSDTVYLPLAMGSAATDIDSQIERDDLTSAVRKALHDLPEQQRLIVILRWHHQMTYEAVAATTGLTVKAVRLQLERAYRSLRPTLGNLMK